MRRSIGIPAKNLLKSRQRIRRLATSSCTSPQLVYYQPTFTAVFRRQTIETTRFFSTSQIETHSLTEPVVASKEERALTEATTAMERHCRANEPQQAQEILQTMEEQDLLLHSSDYLKVIKCYIRLNQVDAAQRLLTSMKQRPCREAFPLVVPTLIKTNKLSLAKQVLYNYMDRGMATSLSFNTIISAYIRANKKRQAVALVHKMDDYARKGYAQAKPDRMTITAIMQLLANKGHARDARALLERMWTSTCSEMQPDAVTYSLVFSAYAHAASSSNNVVDSSNAALDLMRLIKERFQQQGKKLSMRPNTVVYNSFLSVLANAGDGERAELVLQEMMDEPDLHPNVVTYGTVLQAWKNASRGDKAEALLQRIPHPDLLCYSLTIAALAKQGEAQRAEAILRNMMLRDMSPNTTTYTSLLNAYANKKDDPDALEHAKRILREMGQDPNIQIDTPVYNTFLKAIQHSFMLDNKVHAVRSVLKRMQLTNCLPNTATYRQAISAVAATHGDASIQQGALLFCFKMYREIKSRNPEASLDACMLEACAKLSPHGMYGDDIVEQVFGKCCQEGIVTSMHTRLLAKAASDELLKKIFKVDTINHKMFRSLPKSWSRKMKARRGGKKRGKKKR